MGSTSKAAHLQTGGPSDQSPAAAAEEEEARCFRSISLLGGRRLLEVPQFDGLVLGGRDQDRLYGVEGQVPDRVEVAPQGELGVPGFPQSVLVVDLRKRLQLDARPGGGALLGSVCLQSAYFVRQVVGLVGHRQPSQFSQSQFIGNGFVHSAQDEGLPRRRQKGHRLCDQSAIRLKTTPRPQKAAENMKMDDAVTQSLISDQFDQ